MTQSPQSGQAAPRNTDVGTGHSQNGYGGGYGQGAPSAWGSTSTNGAPAADAATGAMPLVTGSAAPRTDVNGTGPTFTSNPPAGQAAPRSGRANRSRGPRRARLQLRHINPWTVFKFSCVLSIALFFVWLIVVGVLFGILDGAGIIDKINNTVTTINGAGSQPPVTAGVVFGSAAIIGVVNIVLFIALSTVGSVVYNLCADLVGGVEITLSER